MSTALVPSAAPWPPLPDLDSIRDLVRAADPEGLIADGSPVDEYEPEEEAIFAGISHLATGETTSGNLLPIIEEVWHKSFAHDEGSAGSRKSALRSLAKQIARFFGPEAQPQTRQS